MKKLELVLVALVLAGCPFLLFGNGETEVELSEFNGLAISSVVDADWMINDEFTLQLTPKKIPDDSRVVVCQDIINRSADSTLYSTGNKGLDRNDNVILVSISKSQIESIDEFVKANGDLIGISNPQARFSLRSSGHFVVDDSLYSDISEINDALIREVPRVLREVQNVEYRTAIVLSNIDIFVYKGELKDPAEIRLIDRLGYNSDDFVQGSGKLNSPITIDIAGGEIQESYSSEISEFTRGFSIEPLAIKPDPVRQVLFLVPWAKALDDEKYYVEEVGESEEIYFNELGFWLPIQILEDLNEIKILEDGRIEIFKWPEDDRIHVGS